MIPQETVAKILDAARVEEVVGDFVTLKRRGANYIACCPFHNEKTPSFSVSPVKGLFKCFGCGKAGSAVGFVMEHEHCSYVEALRYLAAKYHIEIVEKEESAEDIAARQRTESLYLVNEFAQKFFVAQLDSGEGRSFARAYYAARGVGDEWIEKFGLGWAPRSRNALCQAAVAAGYKEDYLVEAGLAIKREDGSLLDKFYERVTFPIYSVSGRVIAFSCRTLSAEGNVAKYMNSPETEIYIKSRSLFGIWQAKADIAREGKCILVEGNLDVVSMHQAGIRNVVASCGTSLTSEQVRLIGKFTDSIVVMYDDDKAGIHAAVRAVSLILEAGLNVKLVLLPDGDDPDSFCRKNDGEQVRDYIAGHEQDFVSFIAEQELGGSTDPDSVSAVVSQIAEAISLIKDPVRRGVFVGTLASRFSLSEGTIVAKINSFRKKRREDEIKSEERQQRRVEAGLEKLAEEPKQQSGVDAYEPNKIVAKAEEDLLCFLLRYGTNLLQFPSDSEFYSEDGAPTVAEFIDSTLASDGTVFLNEPLSEVYDAYFAEYDKGLEQDDIVKALMDSENRTVAYLASQLSTERYELTVKQFLTALTSVESWLATYVPNTLLVYVERRVENQIRELKGSLGRENGDDEATLKQIMKLLTVQKSLKSKLGREKKK